MSEQNANMTANLNGTDHPTKQFDDRTFRQFNGVHSSHSSRSSSPSIRPIPPSQLPPNSRPIPQSQLPPSTRPSTGPITNQLGNLNLGQKFNNGNDNNASVNSAFLPVTNVVPNVTSSPQQTVKTVPPTSSVIAQTSQNNGPINSQMQFNNAAAVQPPAPNYFQQPVRPLSTQRFGQPNPPLPAAAAAPQMNQQRPPLGPPIGSFPSMTQARPGAQVTQPVRPNIPTFPISRPPMTQPPPQINSQLAGSQVRPAMAPPPQNNQLPQGPPPMNQPLGFQPTSNGPPPLQSQPIPNNRPTMSSNRYPSTANAVLQPQQQQYNVNTYQQQQQQAYNNYNAQPQLQSQPGFQSVTQTGFNKLWGVENYDLLQTPNILPPTSVEPPKVRLGQEALDQANCSPDIFRCTMTKIPENQSLLQKSRLPLGVLIHPFKDLSHLPVIQCNVIVRCRACRTYINPFIIFVDNKRWKCNLCYRINELPEEFQYDPVTKTYGDPSRRPEIKSSTLEYIAPAEYMLRPPQPAVYLFLLDVSRLAVESGYLHIATDVLAQELRKLPGDARTQIGFVAYNSAVHFYSLPEGVTQPQEMTVLDIDDIFLPTPDNLLANLKDRKELVMELLDQLPKRFANSYDTNSALGAALQAAFKLMGATGGRVTVFQASLPNVGPGALTAREDPTQRASTEVAHLNPVNDFYKRLALECSGQQVAVDLFVVNSQYIDLATVSGISRFSGGCLHHFPLLRPQNQLMCEKFERSFRRYLTRKIGFEAVMRIRCTRGLSIHTFHGNFFVRSTDLLSLPNINPDAGFGMQVSIEESLADVQTVCFQAALLYTSSKGERRIRVHTMCLPVASTLHEIIYSADQQCIIGLLAKMAVDRSMQSSLSDAREAFINVAIDVLTSYKISLNTNGPTAGLMAPSCLRLLPLYISALLKYTAFRIGVNTRLDDRVMSMVDLKTKPLNLLMQQVYPDLYPVHELENQRVILNSEEEQVPMPPKLQLTARCLENKGAFLMDTGDHMILLVCPNVSTEFLNEGLGFPNYTAIPEDLYEIPLLINQRNERLHQFINYLNDEKPFPATMHVMRDNSKHRATFFERLIEDRVENALSYHEFLQHLKTQVK